MKKRTKILLGNLLSDVLQVLLVLLGITLISFLLLYLSPGNPAEIWLVGKDGNAGMISEETLHRQEEAMGLNGSFLSQYGHWLGSAFQGDLGVSFSNHQPVTQILAERMRPTLLLTSISLLLTILISVPLGILCAVKKGKWVDHFMRALSFLGISIPSFVLGVLFLWLFCVKLHLLPVLASNTARGLILPIIILTLQSSAKMTQQVRSIVLSEIQKPYVDGARMRGVSEQDILYRHVLRNSAAPILTNISIYAGALLGGSVVIETIFSVNGFGRMAVQAVGSLDYNLVLGFVLWCALVYFTVNLLADLLALLIDPRIRYERRGGETR
ncbi:MAG: ABC transporter permease [Acutalibacteraceae bacterium]|nr:ABC transporter permease [Acutalibacteraceae bacterium]